MLPLALLAAGTLAQPAHRDLGAAGPILTGTPSRAPAEPTIAPAGPVIAGLTYDGSSTWGFAGQDFESDFDLYNVWVLEPFSLISDAQLSEFRSRAFANGNPFTATDMRAAIWPRDAEICNTDDPDPPMLTSMPGAGFFDGEEGITTFDRPCLAAGDYILGWQLELDYLGGGLVYFYAQAGAHDHAGGVPNDGFQWSPDSACWACGDCYYAYDGITGLPTGVNFQLFGEPGDCPSCPDPQGCADWDADNDADSDDFFAFLEALAADDPCADLNNDASIDATDFFLYLDRFVNPC